MPFVSDLRMLPALRAACFKTRPFSTLWKKFRPIFHTVENFFPHYGKKW